MPRPRNNVSSKHANENPIDGSRFTVLDNNITIEQAEHNLFPKPQTIEFQAAKSLKQPAKIRDPAAGKNKQMGGRNKTGINQPTKPKSSRIGQPNTINKKHSTAPGPPAHRTTVLTFKAR